MNNLKALYQDVLDNGELRETRTGKTRAVWKRSLEFDLADGFPAVTAKKLPWKAVAGELLWFLSKSSSISDLKDYTFADRNADKWTIWTDDAKRWNQSKGSNNFDDVGDLYAIQWRDYNRSGVDQISNLIDSLKQYPYERNHIVMAWNPEAISENAMALKPCHVGFQCYVTNDDRLNLNWWQRSWDLFLGGPANIASYALLLHILSKLTGYAPGVLSVDAMDVHLYENHIEQAKEYIKNKTHQLPSLQMPALSKGDEIADVLCYDASDFVLLGYKHSGVIKAPLSVGVS